VTSCVPMTVTVQTMTNVAAMDVDVSVWLHTRVVVLYFVLECVGQLPQAPHPSVSLIILLSYLTS